MRRVGLLVFALLSVLLVLYWQRQPLAHALEQDRCLDQGGAWSREHGACEGLPRPHP